MSIDRREHKRLAAHWRAALQLGDEILHGRTEDVSMGGACVLSEKSIPVGTTCLVYLEVPVPERQTKIPIRIEAKVVLSTLVGNISQFRIGLKFASLTPEDQALLKSKLV